MNEDSIARVAGLAPVGVSASTLSGEHIMRIAPLHGEKVMKKLGEGDIERGLLVYDMLMEIADSEKMNVFTALGVDKIGEHVLVFGWCKSHETSSVQLSLTALGEAARNMDNAHANLRQIIIVTKSLMS